MTDVRMVQLDPLTDDTLLAGWVDAGMDSARHELGDRHTQYTATEVRERSRTMTDHRFVLFAALVGDQVVAEGNVHLPVLDNPHLATSFMSVRPAARRTSSSPSPPPAGVARPRRSRRRTVTQPPG